MIKVTFPEKVRLENIDTENDTFSMSFPREIEKLKASIREIGLLTPLILRGKDANSPLQIISGYKRVIALNELGIDFVPAHIFKITELDDEQALRLSLLENLHSREINCIEISNFLSKLKEKLNIESEKIIEVYLPLLGLAKSLLILNKYLSLQNLLYGFRELGIAKKYNVKILSKLSFLSYKDQEPILELVKKLELGFNLVNELLTLLEEIAGRDNISISDLIKGKSINEILIKDKVSRDQKAELILSFLKEKRYPHIKEFERKIKNHIKHLNLPDEISVELPENFEGDSVTMRLKFNNKEGYRKILDVLIKIFDSEDLKKIMEMI